MADSAIEWTDKTWNPVTGCTKVSPGCAHCYAEGVAERFWAKQYPPARAFDDVRYHMDRLDQPKHWRKPVRIFVNSMSDLFHEEVPYAFLSFVWRTMQQTPQHQYQILTKRAQRMLHEVPSLVNTFGVLPNVWLGVSVENQHFADERIPLLLQTPAAVRFLSCEPLLEGLDLAKHRPGALGLHWCIVGGESGPGARKCELWWIRNIVGQCRYADVPVFVKQLGAKPLDVFNHSERHDLILRDRKGGDMAEWPEDLRVREFPTGVERADASG